MFGIQNRPARSRAPNRKILPAFVGACFFLSGAAGLVYEVLWVRMIDKVIGSAPFAVATVLTVFMAGLALGSYLAGRVIDKFTTRSALLALYGKLELGIGAFALAVPFGIQATQPVYKLLYNRLLEHFWCYQAAAFAGCALVLVAPAALMGATLPVLCRYYVLRHDHIGARTGWLYGLNTVGAALGVILCGFVLIQSLGVWATLVLFAGLNGLIGLSCFLLSRRQVPEEAGPRRPGYHPDAPLQKARATTRTRTMSWPLAIFAVSGFCAMAYEVLWTRLLGLIAGPTSYCFAIVVATFIIGLALGSIIFGPLADKSRNPAFWLIATQMGVALTALAVSQLLGNSQFLFAKLIHAYQDAFAHRMLAQALLIFTVLLAPTLFSGAAFPLVNKLYSRSMGTMGRSLGTAYALNTVGALAGSFIAGFVLIPWLGKADGLRLVILIQFSLAGLWLLHLNFRTRGKLAARLVTAVLLAAGWLAMSHLPTWRTDLLSRGWYRDFGAIEPDLERTGWAEALWKGPERIAGRRQGLEVVFQGEGPAGFTTVEKEVTSLGTVEYALFNSGKADASSHGDRSTQALSAHIPLLLHPHARNVMVLGLASGMTSGEALLYPIQRLDIVEINAQVVSACRQFFQPWNNRCLENPRTRMIIQDGRNHLALTRDTYDVIISEPSNPWMAGLANLYTLEFFQQAKRRLTADGLFAQWIQAYEMDWATFSLLGRTFTAAFPRNALIKVGPVDYLLLGFSNPHGQFDWSMAEKNIGFARRSTNVIFPGVGFLAQLVLTEDLSTLFGPGRLHTDNRPYLEFSAPKMLYSGTLNIDRTVADRSRLSPATLQMRAAGTPFQTLLDLVEFAASANVPMFNILPFERLDPDQQTRYKHAVTDYCGRVLVPSYGIFNDPGPKADCAMLQAGAIRRQLAVDDTRPIDHYNLALALIAGGHKDEAVQSLREAVALDHGYEAAVTALGLLLAQAGDLDDAVLQFARAARLAPGKADPHKYLGMVERRRGALDKAVAHLTTALSLAADDPVALGELGAAYLQQGKNQEAIVYLTRALNVNPNDRESRYYLQLAQEQQDEPPPVMLNGP
jgi:spermidine synthase